MLDSKSQSLSASEESKEAKVDTPNEAGTITDNLEESKSQKNDLKSKTLVQSSRYGTGNNFCILSLQNIFLLLICALSSF